jgi:hypothetical protein
MSKKVPTTMAAWSKAWVLTARTLGSWVRIPLEAWMCVRLSLSNSVLCRFRPCNGLPPSLTKEPYQSSNRGFEKLEILQQSKIPRSYCTCLTEDAWESIRTMKIAVFWVLALCGPDGGSKDL